MSAATIRSEVMGAAVAVFCALGCNESAIAAASENRAASVQPPAAALATPRRFTLTVTRSGSGSVSSVPAGISCGSDCSQSYARGTSVTLRATAATGYRFKAWSGDCAGTAARCTLLMSKSRSATAGFVRVADTQAPTSPQNLGAQAASPTLVNLSWSASSDNVGVHHYDVYRAGSKVGSVKGALQYADPVAPATTYSYAVRAVDAAGNISGSSNVATVTTPAAESTGFFPIGVWVPPAYDFAKWQGRNVNTVVGVTQDFETWNSQANSLGLHMVREPRPDPADDRTETLLLAWAHPDEPDGIFSQVPYSRIQGDYRNWKTVDADRNVFINFVGDLNQYDLATGESGDDWYRKYVAGADWISADSYPVNNNQNIAKIGAMVDHLRALAGSKPVYAFIESADIDPTRGGPGPSPAQLRAEIWQAIIHGVRGIWYFPEQVGEGIPFLYDATPADVAAEMTRQNATITQLAGVLQGPINPSGLSAAVPAPLEAAWRSNSSGKYFFVLNLSNTSRSAQVLSFSGIGAASSAAVHGENRTVAISNGRITDDFGPYAVHIYRID